MKGRKSVNLGCGPVFVIDDEWENFDFTPFSPEVTQANLLQRLPLPDESVGVVYSSHFFEHIPRRACAGFLRECLRVLEPGGRLRLVLPDFENLAREYVKCRDSKDHDKANFVVLEIVDQCVRDVSGGEMGRIFQQIRGQHNSEGGSMARYVSERMGSDLLASPEEMNKASKKSFIDMLRRLPNAARQSVLIAWIKILLLGLPAAFRAQNVSLATVGERHHWLWDFYQLKCELERAGFEAVQRQSASTSSITGFPFSPLDLDPHGRPRKGSESMYVEATKPDRLPT